MSIPVVPIIAAGAGVAVVAAGVHFAFSPTTAVTQGGSPWGGPVNAFLARRGPITFGIKETLLGGSPLDMGERWKRVNLMRTSEATVRSMENSVFYLGAKQVGMKLHIGYDNGPDAFRHTGGSALITYRLIRDTGASPEEAARLLKAAGDAHEGDSYLALYDALHAKNSSAMDVHNNAVGSQVGMRLAAEHAKLGPEELKRQADAAVAKLPVGFKDALRALDAGEQLVLANVLGKIEDGTSVSMTPLAGTQYRDEAHPDAPKGIHQTPHAASAADIYTVDADGVRQVRTMAPHAAGYPQPFKDGQYVPGAERVSMNLRDLLHRPKPE